MCVCKKESGLQGKFRENDFLMPYNLEMLAEKIHEKTERVCTITAT